MAALIIVVLASTCENENARSSDWRPMFIFSSVRCSFSTSSFGAPSCLSRMIVVLCFAMRSCCLLIRFSSPNMSDSTLLSSSNSSAASRSSDRSDASPSRPEPDPPPKMPPKMPPIPSLPLYVTDLVCDATSAATSAGSTEKNLCRIASSADGRSPFASIKRAYGSSSSSSSSSGLNEFFELLELVRSAETCAAAQASSS